MTELVWDPRLNQRRVRLTKYNPVPGEVYWKLISAFYLDEEESQGKHHVFVDTWDEDGNRLVGIPVVLSNGGISLHFSELKPGESYSAAPPMHAAGNAYAVYIRDGNGDVVEGMGLGTIENPYMGHHVSYRLVFQRTIAESEQPPAPPPPTPTDWWRVLTLAYEIAELARKNLPLIVGEPTQRVAELTAVSGSPLTPGEWVIIGNPFLDVGTHVFGVCVKEVV